MSRTIIRLLICALFVSLTACEHLPEGAELPEVPVVQDLLDTADELLEEVEKNGNCATDAAKEIKGIVEDPLKPLEEAAEELLKEEVDCSELRVGFSQEYGRNFCIYTDIINKIDKSCFGGIYKNISGVNELCCKPPVSRVAAEAHSVL